MARSHCWGPCCLQRNKPDHPGTWIQIYVREKLTKLTGSSFFDDDDEDEDDEDDYDESDEEDLEDEEDDETEEDSSENDEGDYSDLLSADMEPVSEDEEMIVSVIRKK